MLCGIGLSIILLAQYGLYLFFCPCLLFVDSEVQLCSTLWEIFWFLLKSNVYMSFCFITLLCLSLSLSPSPLSMLSARFLTVGLSVSDTTHTHTHTQHRCALPPSPIHSDA